LEPAGHTGGADPASPAAAHQEKARVDDSGRSDEAALREQGGTTPPAGETFGVTALAQPAGLAAAREGRADDLKRIVGIGPVNERRLNALGIWHFDQIAAWSIAEAAWVGEHLSFPGRIEREHWVEQARKLATRKGNG
jgi:predicted flap endonuclease-1-like 5' DNA nuclease